MDVVVDRSVPSRDENQNSAKHMKETTYLYWKAEQTKIKKG